MGNLILGFRTPTLPLLPLWEKGVGGMRGTNAQTPPSPLVGEGGWGMRGTMRLPSVYPIRRGISTV
jgi:hypothetical protein